ncbi:MAG: ribosome silencing factor [Candidatus Riflebacteria bacterium]|nr:ribosome silencing factor [Candidatus Riflebacteria bacterium]
MGKTTKPASPAPKKKAAPARPATTAARAPRATGTGTGTGTGARKPARTTGTGTGTGKPSRATGAPRASRATGAGMPARGTATTGKTRAATSSARPANDVPSGRAAPPPLTERMRQVLTILDQKQVEDLVVLAVGDLVGYADYFLIGTGHSQPHVEAMADAVAAGLKIKGTRGIPVERDALSTWVLVDGGEFVLHLFQPEARKYYGLEDLWSDAPRVEP